MGNCKNCGEKLPLDQVQIGGVHMKCEQEYFHDKNQTMFRLRLKTGGTWCVVLPNEALQIITDGDGEIYELQMTKMTKWEIQSMPEFEGW